MASNRAQAVVDLNDVDLDPLELDGSAADAVDHAQRQADLVAVYQDALARAGGDRTQVDDAGQQALTDLVEDLSTLLHVIVTDKLTARFGGRVPDGLAEDCYAEMVAAVIDAAGRFDPARCPVFHSWVTGKQGAARTALTECIRSATGGAGFDARAQRALAIAAQAEKQLRLELGRAPTTAELQAQMTAHSYEYQYERLTAEQRALPEAEWRKLIHQKLVNNGLRKAIEEIAVLRARAAQPASPEDFASGWDFIDHARDVDRSEALGNAASARLEEAAEGGDMADLLTVGVAGMSWSHQQIVAARLAGADADDSSLAAVAARYRVSVAEVKDLVATATARMGAAHAHFAFLAPGVTGQFEEAPIPRAGQTGAIAALLLRRAVSAVS